MKYINLTQGKKAIVDDEDYNKLIFDKWRAYKVGNVWYARNTQGELMHRKILNPIETEVIDHINGDGLFNCKQNLRITDVRGNSQNLNYVDKTSKFPGVSWCNKHDKWRSGIKYKEKAKSSKYFETEEEAYEWYKNAEKIIYEGNKEEIDNFFKIHTPKSKYKGVTFENNKWRARPYINGKLISLGFFNTENEANDKIVDYKRAHSSNQKNICFAYRRLRVQISVCPFIQGLQNSGNSAGLDPVPQWLAGSNPARPIGDKMEVYIVSRIIPYDGMMLEKAYSDYDEAVKHCEAYNKKYKKDSLDEYLRVYQFEIKDKFEGLNDKEL